MLKRDKYLDQLIEVKDLNLIKVILVLGDVVKVLFCYNTKIIY